ncbi:hypothetical protein HAX54_032234 [Datura stramonium]|uniref:Cystatin domain-containing protein n=1 Tax=Datura stramonium TaxID=4076 RepID=A0ABS8RLE3_DATST|nr:hypothetical protein [Datura stramonium]
MAIKFNPILGTLLVVIATVLLHVSDAWGGRSGVIVGSWMPIDITNPRVVEIGKFAVDKHNEETKTKLEFQNIIKGEAQIIAGINYRLVITAKNGGSTHNYLAEAWEKPWENFRNLTFFGECSLENGEPKCIFI